MQTFVMHCLCLEMYIFTKVLLLNKNIQKVVDGSCLVLTGTMMTVVDHC